MCRKRTQQGKLRKCIYLSGATTGFSSSETFEQSTTESVTTGVPSVPPGHTTTICQAVGSIGEFTLNSPDFKVVDGDRC